MEKGFTLIELLVVTIIIALLAAVSVGSYRQGRIDLNELFSVQNIALALRTAQNRSLASDCASPPCRFGAHFVLNDNKIYVFDDVNFNNTYNSGEEVEVVALEYNIFITALSPNPYPCGGSACIDVLFNPPDPKTIFKTTNPTDNFVIITISGGKTVTVTKGDLGEGGSVYIN